jgi:hypothetical protein
MKESPSATITRLCRELGTEPPIPSTIWIGEQGVERLIVNDHHHEGMPVYSASDLLRWDGWGKGNAVCLEVEKGVPVEAWITYGNEYQIDLKEKVDDPDTALQLLAIERLKEIKEENDRDRPWVDLSAIAQEEEVLEKKKRPRE